MQEAADATHPDLTFIQLSWLENNLAFLNYSYISGIAEDEQLSNIVIISQAGRRTWLNVCI